MKARAAVSVPAAVISIGNIRGRWLAASSTPLYPAIVAIDDSASMLWARVMRGISSIENAVTPACASVRIASGAPSGSAKPITTCPLRSRAVSGGTERTWRMMSAAAKTSSRDATSAPDCA